MGAMRAAVVAAAILLLSSVLLGPVGACRVVSIESDVLPFISGEYALAGWQPSTEVGAEEIFDHNGRPVYASTSKPRRFLYHIQVGRVG